ncbi:MAG TPA: hypothetical protein VLH13_03500 [Methanomassiliicoccales archaeon]|nr:hypothetical protein [Methanomassiliicoccales archaeon]
MVLSYVGFTIDCVGRREWITGWRSAALMALPGLVAFSIVTEPFLHLYNASYTFVENEGLMALSHQARPKNNAWRVFEYAALILATRCSC